MAMSPESFLPDDSLVESAEELRIKTECREFIEAHKEKIPDALLRLLKDHQFILVGERHALEAEPIRREIAKCLPALREGGLTDVALELDIKDQALVDSLDYSDPQVRDLLKKKIIAPQWNDGNFDILIEAKKNGLKVRLIDCTYKEVPGYRKDEALFNNERDEIMFSNLTDAIKDSKTLVVVGTNHVPEKITVEKMDGKNEYIKRMGAHLAEGYTVASVRFVDPTPSDEYVGGALAIDALPARESKAPLIQNLYDNPTEPVILPATGPLKGDTGVSASGYIITMIGSSKK